MQTLLLGRWDHAGNLVIEESHQIEDDDEAEIKALVDGQDDEDLMAWAVSFPTAHHRAAVDAAFYEYVHDTDSEGNHVGGTLIDKTTGLRAHRVG